MPPIVSLPRNQKTVSDFSDSPGNNASGEAVGDTLRRIRQERGFSIEQVAGLTRISPRYIQALEEGRLADFPSEVTARGFVRLFARVLGLNEQDVIRRFSKEADAFFRKTVDQNHETRRQTERTQNRKKRFRVLGQVFIIVAFGLAIVLVYGINSSRLDLNRFFSLSAPSTRSSAPNIPTELERGTESTVSPASPSSLIESGPIPDRDPVGLSELPAAESGGSIAGQVQADPRLLPDASESAASLETNESAGAAPTAPLVSEPNSGQEERGASKLPLAVNIPGQSSAPVTHSLPQRVMILYIEAVEDSWVSAKIDNRITKEVLLKKGENLTWEASEQFLMSFGNAGGVRVHLDGEPLPVMGPSGAVVKNVLITRESHR